MKNLFTILFVCIISVAAYAQPKANFTTDKFDNFTLHTYASFDAMADVSFIVEGENGLVIIEPQAFEGHVEEFKAYVEKLNKPIEKILVSFHSAGLSTYEHEHKVITKPMAAFNESEGAKGMLGYFDQAFGGKMDTKIVKFDEHIDANSTFSVDGVEYILEPTSLPGMPGVNISIDGKVYYQHFAPAKGFHASKNQITNIESIDAALVDANKAKKGGYVLLLGSHGYGKAGLEDLKFQIKYLKEMKKIAAEATTSEDFLKQMNAKYPECQGEDINDIAISLYK